MNMFLGDASVVAEPSFLQPDEAKSRNASARRVAACARIVPLSAVLHGTRGLGLVLLALAASTPVRADDRALESVVVTATRSAAEALNVPASATVVGPNELEERNPLRLGDALADVPGLYIRGAAMGVNFPGTGQGVLSLRGIPRTPRTLVMIDGQPVNNALTGGIDVAGIPLASVERVEVVRGPYSALYGGSAMGGVINFITAAPDDALTEVRLGAGSFRQRGASLVHRKRYESGLGVSMSVAYRESEGDPDSDYVVKQQFQPRAGTPPPPAIPVAGVVPTRDPDGTARYWVGLQGARPWYQDNAQLSLYYSPSAATDLVAGLGWGEYSVGYSRPRSFLRDAAGNPVFTGAVSFDDAGVARRLSLEQTDWFTPTPAGERDRRAFVRASHRFDGGSRLQAQLGVLRHNLFFSQAAAGAQYASGRGVFTDQPNRRIDGELSLRTPMSATWTLIGGLSMNRSKLDRSDSMLSDWRERDTAGAPVSADGGQSSNLAVFVQSEHDLAPGWSLYLGGRYDRFQTEGYAKQYSPMLAEQRFDERSFDQFSPKLALVWQARPALSLRASYGRGFRPPALYDLYGSSVVRAGPLTLETLAAPDLVPERVSAFELGADLSLGGQRRASVTLYRQRLEDLIYRRTLPGSTPVLRRLQNENVAAADVDGVEASLRWPTPVAGLVAFGSLTHHFRFEVAENDSVPEMVGKELTDVPRTSWSAGVEYRQGAWSGLLALRHVDHVFGSGDDLNRDRVEGVFTSYDGYTVATARAGWQIDRNWGVNLSIDNLTDRKYFVYTRQPGRTFYGELVYRF
ncbi:MAG: TonB-dependent receptor [Burkholderiaceae bacterium]|nr:TonB-dependent receptor [Burkholderiaceae bacterium]